MRQLAIDYIKGLALKSFRLSEELPFAQNDVILYLKNPKRIYVDDTQVTVEAAIPLLNGVHIDAEVNTVRVYFASDSKQQPMDYADTVDQIRRFKDTVNPSVYYQRNVSVETEYEQDLTVTTIEFRFTKLS